MSDVFDENEIEPEIVTESIKADFVYALLGDLTALQEELAAFAHSQWSGWMEYLFSKCHVVYLEPTLSDPDGEPCLVIPKWAVDRWKRQIQTDYKELSEEEKNSDRKEAAAMIDIIRRHFA